MTETFNIELFHGHLIFEYNGLRVLVDTGSPITFGRDKEFEFMGKQCSCQTEFAGNAISDIASMMRYDVDVLMGLDLITQFRMKTDYQKKEITFSTEEIPFESQCSIPNFSSQLRKPSHTNDRDAQVDGNLWRYRL